MLRYILLSTLIACFASCKKKEEKKEATPAVEPTAADTNSKADEPKAEPGAVVLVIKAAKLGIEIGDNNPDGSETLSIDDDGNIKAGDKEVGKLSADGKVHDLEGKLLGSISAEGVLSIEGEDEQMTIGADGSITVDGKVVSSIGADGLLKMEELSEKVMYEGPEEAKRAIMVVFMMAMMVRDEETSEDPAVKTVEPAVAPAPEAE